MMQAWLQRFLVGALMFSGACNCENPDVTANTPDIEVTPRALAFGQVFAGTEKREPVTVKNIGGAVLNVTDYTVTGDPRFALDGDLPTFLPSGSSTPITVVVRGSTTSLAEGLLRISSDDPDEPTVEVPLTAVVVAAPPCDDGNVCTTDTFDPETETCGHTFADGTPCQPADRCIVEAVCSQGVCLGKSKDCNDNSPCTRDVCRQIDGQCLFLVSEETCDDDNPCTADSCSTQGCVNEPLPNGSACDDADLCTSGDACFAGQCQGTGVGEGNVCDDNNSCTRGDVCRSGVCTGTSIVDGAPEGTLLFSHDLTPWPYVAFLHRREVSVGDTGILYALDHLNLFDNFGQLAGLTHVVSTMKQCGSPEYQFQYRPPDPFVIVNHVRRAMQVQPDDTLRIVVGVRQLPDNGFEPQTTQYLLDRNGQVLQSRVRARGGETGRSLLPDGSHIYGVIWPITLGQPPPGELSRQNLVVVREDRTGQVLWRHERAAGPWAEFLGVAGPRVLFWSNNRFGALDFNTGATVWTYDTRYITKEMALSTELNLGVTRVGNNFGNSQILGIDILMGAPKFTFPAEESQTYRPRTDPLITADGRIVMLMERADISPAYQPTSLEWTELSAQGEPRVMTPLPYTFRTPWVPPRIEDDPSVTVASDGVAYVGYDTKLWAIDPGGNIRWTYTSTIPDAFTGAVPNLRDDGVLVISEGARRFIGIKTNGGTLTSDGWPAFRHDNRRTNYTP